MKPSDWPRVEVLWYDAVTADRGGWIEIPELDKWKRGCLCHSIGYMVSNDADKISIASHFNLNHVETEIESVSGTFVIPKGMVLKIKRLK